MRFATVPALTATLCIRWASAVMAPAAAPSLVVLLDVDPDDRPLVSTCSSQSWALICVGPHNMRWSADVGDYPERPWSACGRSTDLGRSGSLSAVVVFAS